MSCFGIQYNANGEKVIFPIPNEKAFRNLRDTPRNIANFRRAKEGDNPSKLRLLQMAFNIVGPKNQKLKETCMYGNSFFFDYDDPDTRETFLGRCLARKEEAGLLFLERSVHGAHAVFRREKGQTILENQARIAALLDCEWDNQAKDAQRIVFCSPSSEILFFHPDLLCNEVEDEEAARAEYAALQQRASSSALKRDKHCTAMGEDSALSDGGQGSNSPFSSSSFSSSFLDKPSATLRDVERSSSSPSIPGAAGEPPSSIDYESILPKFLLLENPAYPEIVEGMRNDTLFGVCAKYLRYCCDHNFEKMKGILYPDFSFGLPEKEVDVIIRSALSRERGLTPKVVKKLIASTLHGPQSTDPSIPLSSSLYPSVPLANGEPSSLPLSTSLSPSLPSAPGAAGEPPLSFTGLYPSVDDSIADELLMPKLPKFLDIVLKYAPVGQKFVVLGAAIPALMTLLTNCNVKFGSKAISRLNGWTHVDGPPAAGKGLICPPIELLTTPIREQDERNKILFNRVVQNRTNNPNSDHPDPIPRVGMRLLVADTTRKSHIATMALLEPLHTYTLCPEISSLRMYGYYDRKDFCRLLFDNGIVGTNNNTETSEKISTPCNWNVTTSSTRDQTLNFWRNVTDGSVTRVLFLLMPDTTFSEMPTYVQYTDQDKAYVIRAARLMMLLSGLVQTPRLSGTMLAWLHRVLEETRAAGDTIRAIFRKRSADIAFYFASVIHLCYCVQQILDEEDALREKEKALQQELEAAKSGLEPDQNRIDEVQERLLEHQRDVAVWKSKEFDLSRFPEKKSVSDMANYVADYCLDTQCQIWGQKMQAQLTLAYQGVARRKKKDDRFDRAPLEFTVQVLREIFSDMSSVAIRKMVTRWQESKLIRRISIQKQVALYRKV